MIKIDYDREKNSTLIFCGDMSFMDSLLPLKIQMKNIITGEIHYTTHLFSNMWSCWNGAELITDILIYTNDGNLLEEYKWSVLQHGDEIEKTLWFDVEVTATKEGDFFYKKQIDYNKKSKSITEDDLF